MLIYDELRRTLLPPFSLNTNREEKNQTRDLLCLKEGLALDYYGVSKKVIKLLRTERSRVSLNI